MCLIPSPLSIQNVFLFQLDTRSTNHTLPVRALTVLKPALGVCAYGNPEATHMHMLLWLGLIGVRDAVNVASVGAEARVILS